MLAIWSLVPLPSLNPAWTSGSSQFTYCCSLTCRILSITLLVCDMSAIVCLNILWHCLSLGLEWKLIFFKPCGHCWVFQISWYIDCSTFTASSFRIWSSPTGIPSLPLALFIVMLPKSHLISYPRMSGSRWVIIPSWLSGSWRTFFAKLFHVFLSPLLNIFCFCYVHTVSVLYWAHLYMKCCLGISHFLEEISSLSHSIVLCYFFALITEEGFLMSPC